MSSTTEGKPIYHINITEVKNFISGDNNTIINHNDSNDKQGKHSKETKHTDFIQQQAEILQYIGNLKPYVAEDWKNRYEQIWRSIIQMSEVKDAIFDVGKQKDTSFNRNLVANIIFLMCENGVIIETPASTLALALENNKEHSVRAQLRLRPENDLITEKVQFLLQ